MCLRKVVGNSDANYPYWRCIGLWFGLIYNSHSNTFTWLQSSRLYNTFWSDNFNIEKQNGISLMKPWEKELLIWWFIELFCIQLNRNHFNSTFSFPPVVHWANELCFHEVEGETPIMISSMSSLCEIQG